MIDKPDLEMITFEAGEDLKCLRGSRFFITGGTGYIGKWLLESIRHANQSMTLDLETVVLSRNPGMFAKRFPHLAHDDAISFVQGDIRDFADVVGDFTHVIHAATDVIAPNTPLEMFDVTVLGTRHILEFVYEHAVQNILLLSSGAVYGQIPEDIDRVSETFRGALDVTLSREAYGLGKIATEWLGNAWSLQHGFACKTARIFAQVGPNLNLDAHFAAGNFIRNALLGRNLLIRGDGTPLRSYMYATDLVVWLWAILVRGQSGLAYNVGSDESVSVLQLAQTIAKICGISRNNIDVLGLPIPAMASNRYVPDVSLARDELGVSVNVPFEEALKRTITWYKPYLEYRRRHG